MEKRLNKSNINKMIGGVWVEIAVFQPTSSPQYRILTDRSENRE